MIIKSFNIADLKKSKSNFFLFYGENEGQKEDIIKSIFTNDFIGEIIKYEESQILENKDNFFELCLGESLFDEYKIIQVTRVTPKLYDVVKEITSKNINKKKIFFISENLEKKSKIRRFFEDDKKLVCTAFYKDNGPTLYKIADEFFKKNKISISSENINLIIGKCDGDRKKLKNDMDKINQQTERKLVKILTKEQFKIFKIIQEEQRNQLRLKLMENRGK